MGIPALDCHAHVSPEVTDKEIERLRNAVVFSVTRSLKEAERVVGRTDSHLVWGCGTHPGLSSAIQGYDPDKFSSLVSKFALVGEVGLDRKAGHLDKQSDVLRSILRIVKDEPVLVTIHSAGCVEQTLEIIAEQPHPGLILHWFKGSRGQIKEATALGCYFSVNAAMSAEALDSIPIERMLPETDYPFAKRAGGGVLPGDTSNIERRAGKAKGLERSAVRRRWYRNLRRLAMDSGALDRLSESVADLLLMV